MLGAGGTTLPRAFGGSGVTSETRPVDAASRTSDASSGIVLTGRHSSIPSCHTSESSVTAPSAALRRSSPMRTGPTGTPLIAAYHSSALDSSRSAASSVCIDDLNAFASPPSGLAPGRGTGGFACARLVARGDFCGSEDGLAATAAGW